MRIAMVSEHASPLAVRDGVATPWRGWRAARRWSPPGVGSLSDTVVDGVTGELVAPRDPAGLGKAVRQLLASHTRRLAYGSAGADRVRCCYTWPDTAERLATVYQEVSWAVAGFPDAYPGFDPAIPGIGPGRAQGGSVMTLAREIMLIVRR